MSKSFVMLAKATFIAVLAGASLSAWGQNDEPRIGPSGNPIPRFVSLSAGKAFMRTGPGRQYPVDWVYERPQLPLEIIDEYGAWRQVRDHEGATGWMLVSLLFGPRTAIIRGKTRELVDKPSLEGVPVIIAEPGVIGVIEECDGLWCELEIAGESGWIERRHLWGVYANETID